MIRILNVGQCGYDSAQIESLLTREFGATVEHCPTKHDAIERYATHQYDLTLVNRLLDYDHSSGLDVIRELLNIQNLTPIMLVSNLADAQDSAVELGAVRGFGKAKLNTPETIQLIRSTLNTPREPHLSGEA